MFSLGRITSLGIFLGALILSATGCANHRDKPTAGIGKINFAPLERVEYEVTDQIVGTGRVVRILGVRIEPLFFDSYTAYLSTPMPWNVSFEPVGSLFSFQSSRDLAVYDALAQAEDADTILPLSTLTENRNMLFLYTENTTTVRAKAIKIKSDDSLYYE